jgi:hypothetical protein
MCECIYVTAPHQIDTTTQKSENGDEAAQTNANAPGEPVYAWWSVEHAAYFTAQEYIGLEATLDHLRRIWREHGPFDGVLGFSQGGVLASLLCTRRDEFPFDFVIIVSAFPSSLPFERDAMTRIDPEFRSLHVWGEGDTLIVPSRSQQLSDLFPSLRRSTFAHPGGHVVPTSSAAKPVFREFLQSCIEAASSTAPS